MSTTTAPCLSGLTGSLVSFARLLVVLFARLCNGTHSGVLPTVPFFVCVCVCVCDLDRLDQEPLLEGGDGAHTCWAAELWQIHIRRRHCGSYVTLVASQTKAPVQNLGERTSAGKCCLMCCTSWGLFALFCLSCSHALRCAFFCSLENTTRT